MLRPVRPLRRSVDTSRRGSNDTAGNKEDTTSSRRASQLSRSASHSAVPSTFVVLDNVESTTRRDVVAETAVVLPRLQPCAASRPARPTPTSFHPPSKVTSGFAASLELAKMNPRVDTDPVTCIRSHGGKEAALRSATSPLDLRSCSTPPDGDGVSLQRGSALPAAGQRLFTSAEIEQLRVDARFEYTRGRRQQERKDVVHEEEEQRHLLLTDALHQILALRDLEKGGREAILRAKSAEALPLQYLEQRIQTRIASDYAQNDAKLRQEGRAAWMEQVAKSKDAGAEARTSDVERRAASHRFRAALTFIVVQERNMRSTLQADAAHDWEAFVLAEEASKAETAHQALVRFLNTPEQLAAAAARERRESRLAKVAAKQRKIFQDQQDGFTKGCHHGTGGTSVFEGDAPRRICGRCRVKWDEELGYLVSLDRTVKTHPPPQPPATEYAKEDGNPSAKMTEGTNVPSQSSTLPVLTSKAKK